MFVRDHQQQAFTLLELLLTAGLTALLMLGVTTLFITFLLTATKNRLNQNVRESGTSAMQKMTELLRNANSVSSNCTTADESGAEMEELSLIGPDGLTTTFSEIDDKIASSSAENGTYFLTSGEADGDRLRNLLFTCYATELGPKYVNINFTLSTLDNQSESSPNNSSLDFNSGVSLRN